MKYQYVIAKTSFKSWKLDERRIINTKLFQVIDIE